MKSQENIMEEITRINDALEVLEEIGLITPEATKAARVRIETLEWVLK